jgi:hypothetical protein
MTTAHAGTGRTGAVTRRIGPLGTVARVVAGLALLGGIGVAHSRGDGLDWPAWPLGFLVLPAAAAAAQGLWTRHRRVRFVVVGGLGYAVNVAVALALYLPQLAVPGLDVLWHAGVLFLGVSLLLAAVRGYAGCELLAVSNWVLRRDDQLGCVVLSPIDRLEAARAPDPA